MMFTTDSINKSSSVTQTYFAKLPQYLLTALTIITVLVVFVFINPALPVTGLDPSWIFATNEAVALHLNFGKEIIYTVGPYASMYTRNYHPAIDHLMVFGGLFLGLSHAVALLYLAKDKKYYLLLLAMLIYLVGVITRDTLFFIYPLILAVCATKFISEVDPNNKKNITLGQWLLIAVTFSTLGLLPLIKGSFLLLCGAISIAIACYFLYYRYLALGLLVLISPIVSTLILWILAGQSIFALPGYLSTIVPIISGYTEAMAIQGNNTEIVAYLLGSIAIVWSLISSANLSIPSRLFLGFCFLLFLFVAFKAGFVRHDDHTASSASALVLAALIFSFVSIDTGKIFTITSYPYLEKMVNKNGNKNIMSLILIFFSGLWVRYRLVTLVIPIIASIYVYTPKGNKFNNPIHICINSWDDLHGRLTKVDYFRSAFEQFLNTIRQQHPIPTLQGTTDVYPFEQSYLLASNNKWNPRPMIQSYAAYTALLARINEQHLRGDNAPDNILFSIHTIDGRFPSLDDGLSWPAILDNYTINKVDNNFEFIYFSKKSTLQKNSRFDVLYDGDHKTGEQFAMPSTNMPVYAEINLKPTLLGKLLGLLFKPPQLAITLKLKNGSSEQYRVIANMMESGFFISPLIRDTKDFLFMGTGNLHYIDSNTVESFTISPAYGGSLFWSENYQLKLKAYQMSATNNTFKLPFDAMIDFPEKYTEAKPTHCTINQSIDQVNGISVAQPKLTVTSLLAVNGWLAFSAPDGIAADETFITLTDSQGGVKYLKTQHIPRTDVIAYFKQPAMPADIGFISIVDVTKLQGDYTLGLARTHAGVLEQCLETIIPITIKQTTHHESQ